MSDNKGLNVPKEKAPAELFYAKEYIYNDGYHFANCEWPNRLNKFCYYLAKGCTGCTIYPAYAVNWQRVFKNWANSKRKIR